MDTFSTAKILIVENDTEFREALSSHLKRLGYLLLIAETGDMAMDLLQQNQPNLILANAKLAQQGNLQLFKNIIRHAPAIPIIILSKFESDVEASHFLSNGAWDYLASRMEDVAILEHSIKRGLERVSLNQAGDNRMNYLELEVRNRTAELLHQNLILENEIVHRKKQEELVQEAKTEWEQTFDALPDLIYLSDREGKVKRMNLSLTTRLGIAPEETVDAPFNDCQQSASAATNDACLHQNVLVNKVEQTREVYEENLGGYFDLTVAPYHDVNGQIVGTVHVARNINDRKIAEKEREKLHARLLHSQKLESVGQLAAGIAHEINTPTQFISTNIEFLEEAFVEAGELFSELNSCLTTAVNDGLSKEKIQSLNQRIQDIDLEYLLEEIPTAILQSKEGIHRVSSIVQAMKEFSHPGSKDKKRIDLNRVIETTVTVARNEWKYVAEVVTDLDPEMSPVLCLPDEMGQVFLNILVNAAHAIENILGKNPEGRKGIITINTKQHEHHLEITVRDTGAGIPEKSRGRIFDPFYTTKDVGRGTGQGLAIAHDVITQKHNGTITFETETNKGTTFVICLPTGTDG